MQLFRFIRRMNIRPYRLLILILFKVDWGEKGIGWVRYFEIVILPDFTYEDDGDDHISVSSNDKEGGSYFYSLLKLIE